MDFLFSTRLLFYEMFGFGDVLGILYKHGRFYQFHQMSLLWITTSWHAHQKIRLDELIKTAHVLLYLNIFGILSLGIISGAIGCYLSAIGRHFDYFGKIWYHRNAYKSCLHGIHINRIMQLKKVPPLFFWL